MTCRMSIHGYFPHGDRRQLISVKAKKLRARDGHGCHKIELLDRSCDKGLE